MESSISRLLKCYERGKISRRHLVGGLAALAAGAASSTAAPSTFQARDVNHVALIVTDVARSKDFYMKLLGMPVVRESPSSCFLGLGRNFLALFRNSQAGMNHYCISMDDYRVGPVTEELQRQGLNPRQPRGSARVYFDDPDGIEVQLATTHHQP